MLFRLALLLCLTVALQIGCEAKSQPTPSHSAEEKPVTKKPLYEHTPLEFLSSLKVHEKGLSEAPCLSLPDAPKDWLTFERVLPLLPFADSKSPCRKVTSFASSKIHFETSTTGLEARRIILGYCNNQYPPGPLKVDIPPKERLIEMLREKLLKDIDTYSNTIETRD